MSSDRTRHAQELFAGLGNRYETLAELLSFGQNGRWRRAVVSAIPTPQGAFILDVATGTARVARELAGRGARVIGLDQNEPMLRVGASEIGNLGLATRIRLVLGQGERLPFADAVFDAVTFTYLLRYVDDPAATLEELARVLRPGGMLANLEFSVPSNPITRGAWRIYTRAGLPLAGALFSHDWHEVGRFLGPSIESFYGRYPLSAQLQMWRDAGMRNVTARTMSLGGGVVIKGERDGT